MAISTVKAVLIADVLLMLGAVLPSAPLMIQFVLMILTILLVHTWLEIQELEEEMRFIEGWQAGFQEGIIHLYQPGTVDDSGDR